MAATMKMRSLFVYVFLITWLSSLTHGKPKYVQTKLNAKWAATPLLLETSEFLGKENNDLFWNFVNDISEFDPAAISGNEESMYHLALKVAGRYLSPLQMQLLKFSLSIRAHSPAVEMFNMMAKQKSPPQSCTAFMDIHKSITCDINAAKAFINLPAADDRPMMMTSDHQYPRGRDSTKTVILYGQLGTPEFSELHKELRKLADNGKIHYVLRHFVKNPSKQRVRLSGYGVGLAIKNQEYKAKDDTKVEVKEEETKEDAEEEVQGFVFSTLKKEHPDLTEDLKAFRAHLEENDDDMKPLKVWQLQDLSFQAAQRVMSAPKDEALGVLEDVSQNFPVRARSLAKTSVNSKMRSEILKNQRVFESSMQVGAGESTFLINGQQLDMDVHDVFSLLDFLKTDGKRMEGLHALGFRGSEVAQLLTLDLGGDESNYAVDIRDPAVVYVNNIEKDRKYSGWPSSMQEMLRPTFPGMLRHVRKNFFHMIFIVNPADPKHKELVKMAEAFYVHSAPVRIGMVMVVDQEAAGTDDAGVALLQAFSYISKQHSGSKALSFITDVFEQVGEAEITSDAVIQEFEATYPSAGVTNVFGANSDYNEWRKACHDYLTKTGLGTAPQVLINGVPLKGDEMRPDNIEDAVVMNILKTTPGIQKAIYNGKLYDGVNLLDYLMTQPNVMPRLNARILSSTETVLDLTKEIAPSLVQQPESFKNLPVAEMTGALLASMKYLTKKDEASSRPVTLWIVCDLETPEGRLIAYDGLKHLKHSNNIRIGFIHNPRNQFVMDEEKRVSHFITKAVHVATETLDMAMAKSYITKLLKEENIDAMKTGKKSLEDLAVNKMDINAYMKALEDANLDFLKSHQIFCVQALGFQPGERGVISNGKVIGPLQSDEVFFSEDFGLLEKNTMSTSADKVMSAVKKSQKSKEPEVLSNLVMRLSSLLKSGPRSENRRKIDYHQDQHSMLHLPGNDNSPAFDIVVILDPLSRAAQKYSTMLIVLQKVFNTNIRIFLNPKEKLSEAPLKVFYRFVLEEEVSFTVDSESVAGPVARFNKVPQKPLLTMGLDAPEAWLVESVRAPYDLDNLYLEEVSHGVNAEYELEYLLLEGHCYDSGTGQPPRGLQFVLGTASAPAQVDTIVMANLGYFQLKANPGAWQLQLRPGRSADIYDISSHDYTDSPPDSPEVLVVMDSFKSKIIKVRVNKKKGRERDDLLGDEPEAGGIWDSISSKIEDYLGFSPPGLGLVRSFTGGTDTEKKKDETLNIFSVASGHLYERFLRIMMISVLKNTQSKVKFWFLKNFLSPTFKDFIPEMAKEYKFEYELVQYKWPRWLHQQTEKQRIIWGYKILFLDVLFPLHVDKFIFVDADQIVRTDLKELNDLDLEGAPYGYTPFCEDKREMDGFRFWKSGYWASHLAGRKYHISALYVVDLKKFRRIAAGDRLRGQYQGLSQDPNSLSNLDQDLPNNMIHQVAIKSLPQEWLWCETWCGERQKKYAKTIDLCNNPLTKEPKLEAAMRIVPEWNDYDREIKQFWDRVLKARTFIDEENVPLEKTDKINDEL